MSTMNPPNEQQKSKNCASSGDGDQSISTPSTSSHPQNPSTSYQMTVSVPSTSGDSNRRSEPASRSQVSSSEEQEMSTMQPPNVNEEAQKMEINSPSPHSFPPQPPPISHQNPDPAPSTSNEWNQKTNIRNFKDALSEMERLHPSIEQEILESETVYNPLNPNLTSSTGQDPSSLYSPTHNPTYRNLENVRFSNDDGQNYQEVMSPLIDGSETMSAIQSPDLFIQHPPACSIQKVLSRRSPTPDDEGAMGALQSPDPPVQNPLSDDDPDEVATKNAVERIDNYNVPNPPHPEEIVKKFKEWRQGRRPGKVNIKKIFEMDTRTMSVYLVTPQPWDKCGKETVLYLRMHNWLQLTSEEKEEVLLFDLNAYRAKHPNELKCDYKPPMLPEAIRKLLKEKIDLKGRALSDNEMSQIAIEKELNYLSVYNYCRNKIREKDRKNNNNEKNKKKTKKRSRS